MTAPKDLLDERLARGEISHEEYDRIVGKIALQPPASSSVKQPPTTPANGFKREGWWGFVIFGIGANFLMFSMIGAGIKQGLSTGFNSGGILLVALFSLVAVFGLAKLAFGK